MQRIKLTIAMLAVLCATTAGLWPLTTVKGQSGGLAAPTGVAASDGSYNNKIGISWDVMRGATRYQVFRHTVNDPAAAVSIGTTVEAVFYDTTAVAGQTYFYWVRAENAQGASSLSAPDAGTRANGAATGLNPPSAPAGNPVTATKVALGKALFWDEQLSSTRTVACGTCHHASNGGADPRSLNNTRATHLGGTGLRRITGPGICSGSPKWSADSKQLVFYEIPVESTWDARVFGLSAKATSQIVSLDLASGKRTEQTTGPGLKLMPQFLPDGRVGFLMDGSAS